MWSVAPRIAEMLDPRYTAAFEARFAMTASIRGYEASFLPSDPSLPSKTDINSVTG